MEKIIVVNLKMNLRASVLPAYLDKAVQFKRANLIICPSFLYLPYFINKAFHVGAQDCSVYEKGSYTGEVGASQISSLGIKYVILGHSERRVHFGEDGQVLQTKIELALKAGLKIIYCVGECLSERDEGRTAEVLTEQLKVILNIVPLHEQHKLMIAYEPVWAIGTGKSISNDLLTPTIETIKAIVGNDISILYGGSVDEHNITELNKIKQVNGFLIATAAQDADKLGLILNKLDSYE